jgi:hypothetical protein
LSLAFFCRRTNPIAKEVPETENTTTIKQIFKFVVRRIIKPLFILLCVALLSAEILSFVLTEKVIPKWALSLYVATAYSSLPEGGGDELVLTDIDADGTPEVLLNLRGMTVKGYRYAKEQDGWDEFPLTGHKIKVYRDKTTGETVTVSETHTVSDAANAVRWDIVHFENGAVTQEILFYRREYTDANMLTLYKVNVGGEFGLIRRSPATFAERHGKFFRNLTEIKRPEENLNFDAQHGATRKEKLKWLLRYFVSDM